VDGDTFVDVPHLRSLNVHPRLFYYPNSHSQLALGYTGTFESRRGGQQQAVRTGAEQLGSPTYFVTNTSQRHTVDAVYTNDSLGTGHLTLKGAITNFGRDALTNTVAFKAYQTTYYTEASYLHALGQGNTIVAGLNANGELLRNAGGSTTPLLSTYTYTTVGYYGRHFCSRQLDTLAALQPASRPALRPPQPVRGLCAAAAVGAV